MNSFLTRRTLLAGASATSYARMLGANDRIRLGIIGTGGRGSYLMRAANQAGADTIHWVAVCDAWDVRRDATAAIATAPVAKIADYRQLLDRRDIDGVIVATWDQLHAQITVDACLAGKDVYVEKPMTSLPMQGHAVVRAVRETGRVVQVGVQQRSMKNFIEAKARVVDSGLLGRVHMVRTVWNANTGYLSPVPAGMEAKPPGLDWDACLGWLPKIPWDPKRYFNRFAYWDFSTGGQTGGLFVHMVDVVHWYLGIRRPSAAVAMGGIYQYDDGRDTADNINLIVEYPEKVNVSFEATISNLTRKEAADIVFLGNGGRLSIFRGGYRFTPSGKDGDKQEILGGRAPEEDHMANWLKCIRTRKEPNANVVDGHYSAMACHIGNIAYKERSRVEWRKEWDV